MTEKMKPVLIGFDGQEPYAIVIVNRIGGSRFKQVCYDLQELDNVFERFSHQDGYVLEVLMAEPLEEVV